ncbi:GAF domain-containing protein/sugar diacid utilization regulator [Pseudarthrobacter siccitolerans]|uniref:GAF domain-containing protein/sugar diacid utilization regulator n=1 Tax=Pseudarthrobacter siccitolerans TaxID=861266 RepID=A0ABU0PNR0_9MICC|nr:GAF domain-containing protein [Pseudarthrobacter siccitolerans]MDQ0675167.1 GAF domain-containing protein/sugar diacid utilization regulator [Pseudarthrobacter siccitolerans]
MAANESSALHTGVGPSGNTKAAGQLMAMLESGISAAELETRLSDWLDAGVIDQTSAAAARRLNARLWEASRREGLLRVLYDTATDLTGIRDVEAVLKAIVRRTRSLIGSDVAYLSLNDYDTGESYVRVTDGATTALFRNIRMPLGEGVLGAVATGEAPAQSADYLLDESKSHLESSDTAVAAEGVRAIMGVPLRAEGKVIGALLVADRHAHDFSSDDVALMESIGTHAAVALENARYFTEMADALTRLDQAQRQNLSHVRALEELSTLDRRLMETLASAGSLPHLLALLTESLSAPVFLVSPMGEPMAGMAANPDFGSFAALSAAEESAAKSSAIEFEVKNKKYTVMSAVAGEQHLASLIVAEKLSAARLAVLERSALVLSVSLLFERTYQDAQYRLQLELIDDLLSPRSEHAAAMTRRAAQFGLANHLQLVVRVVGVTDDQRQRALSVLRHQRETVPGIIALHESHLCIIEPVERHDSGRDDAGDAGRAGQSIVDELKRRRITATVGSSEPVTGFTRLSTAHTEAHAVLRALQALSRSGEAADRAALGTAGMLLGAMESPFAGQLLTAQLGPLLNYDERRGTQLVLTAWMFHENGGATQETADALHIHTNTLRQRLDRIDALVGASWRRGSRSLDVQVALRLWRMKAAGVSSAGS